jgi:hypothetical protein
VAVEGHRGRRGCAGPELDRVGAAVRVPDGAIAGRTDDRHRRNVLDWGCAVEVGRDALDRWSSEAGEIPDVRDVHLPVVSVEREPE